MLNERWCYPQPYHKKYRMHPIYLLGIFLVKKYLLFWIFLVYWYSSFSDIWGMVRGIAKGSLLRKIEEGNHGSK